MGILFGSALAGIGKGLENYNALEEKKRAEQVETDRAYGKMDYAAQLQEEAKAKEEAKKKEKMDAFKSEAAAWRADNPKASIHDFIVHFSDTEHAELLAPTITAAKLMGEKDVHDAQLKHYELQAQQLEAQGKREEARMKREAAADARAASESSERRSLAKTKAEREEEDWQEKKRAKGLLAGAEEAKAQGLVGAEEKYRTELRKMGVKEEKGEGVEITDKYVDDKGHEITRKGKATEGGRAGVHVPSGFNATSDFASPGGPQIFENSKGERIAYLPDQQKWGVYTKSGAAAKPGETAPTGKGMLAETKPQPPEPTLNWRTDEPRTPKEAAAMLAIAKTVGDAERVAELEKAIAKMQAARGRAVVAATNAYTAGGGGGAEAE